MGFSSICCFDAVENNAIYVIWFVRKLCSLVFTGIINCSSLIAPKPCARLDMSSQSSKVREWEKKWVFALVVSFLPKTSHSESLVLSVRWPFSPWKFWWYYFAPWALFYLFNGFFAVFISPVFSFCPDSIGVCSVVPAFFYYNSIFPGHSS